MISVGMFFGLLTGLVMTLIFASVQDPIFAIATKSRDFGLTVLADDLAATAMGVIVVADLSLFINSYRTACLAIGFGLGVPPAFLLLLAHPHDRVLTIGGFFITFLIVALVIISFRNFLYRGGSRNGPHHIKPR